MSDKEELKQIKKISEREAKSKVRSGLVISKDANFAYVLVGGAKTPTRISVNKDVQIGDRIPIHNDGEVGWYHSKANDTSIFSPLETWNYFDEESSPNIIVTVPTQSWDAQISIDIYLDITVAGSLQICFNGDTGFNYHFSAAWNPPISVGGSINQFASKCVIYNPFANNELRLGHWHTGTGLVNFRWRSPTPSDIPTIDFIQFLGSGADMRVAGNSRVRVKISE